MLKIITQTLLQVTQLMLLVGIGYIANTILGALVASEEELFERSILLKGMRKGLLVLISVLLLTTVIVSIFPVIEQMSIVIIDPVITEGLSLVTLIVPIFTAGYYYVRQSIEKLIKLFGLKEDDLQGLE